MRLLEYESKEILSTKGIPIPSGVVVSNHEDVSLPSPSIIKAQIPIGGRQKTGGVLEARDQKEAESILKQMLFSNVRGYRVNKVLVEEKLDIAREFYLGITYDTVAKEPVAIFSTEGGVDIEELARQQPEKVQKRHFSVRSGLAEYMAREMISLTGVSGKTLLGLSNIFFLLANIFLENDATIVEINPLAQTTDGRRVALDCHLEIDDDALFRNRSIAEKEKVPDRITGKRKQSDFEKKAADIDNLDQKGVAGRLIEFDENLGLINPHTVKIGMAGGPVENVKSAYMPGTVAVASRSGGMTTEIANLLTINGIGQSTCISIGGDPVVGSNFLNLIPLFDKDPGTEAVVLFCEPGGVIEERFSEIVISEQIKTPIVAFIAGRFVDKIPGVRFGHAATIVEGKKGTAAGKIEQFKNAGIHVAEGLDDIVSILKKIL